METWVPGTHHIYDLSEYRRERSVFLGSPSSKVKTESRKGKKIGLSLNLERELGDLIFNLESSIHSK